MRFGPLSLKSTMALTNLGVDSNVFNRPDSANPPGDFTLIFTPTTNLWLRLGRTWVDGTIGVDWMYFNRFKTERAANSIYRAGVSRTFNRLSGRAGVTKISARDRPGFEIDVRTQRFETAYDAQVDLRVLPQTFVVAKAAHARMEFEKDVTYFGANLANELSRTRSSEGIGVRHVLTPLTTVSFEVARDHDRFLFSSLRNADSTRVAGTVVLQPLALVNGTAMVGYRNSSPQHPEVPPYRGLVADLRLGYNLRGTTRLGIQLAREAKYSFSTLQPYFLETALTYSVQQRIYGPFDVLARYGTIQIAYRDRIGAALQVAKQVDTGRTSDVGFGYRLGADKRIGFSVAHGTKKSNINDRRFTGFRYGFSVTYER